MAVETGEVRCSGRWSGPRACGELAILHALPPTRTSSHAGLDVDNKYFAQQQKTTKQQQQQQQQQQQLRREHRTRLVTHQGESCDC